MLETKRVIIRALQRADAEILFAYRNDERCSRYQRYDDTSQPYLQNFIEQYGKCVFLSKEPEQHYAVAEKESGKTVGDISIFYSEKDNCFTLGITLAPEKQGQGYGYEILQAVVARLQEAYPKVELVALIEKENEKSLALFKKLGFINEGFAEPIESFVFVKKPPSPPA